MRAEEAVGGGKSKSKEPDETSVDGRHCIDGMMPREARLLNKSFQSHKSWHRRDLTIVTVDDMKVQTKVTCLLLGVMFGLERVRGWVRLPGVWPHDRGEVDAC
jgi:hypothetical protein